MDLERKNSKKRKNEILQDGLQPRNKPSKKKPKLLDEEEQVMHNELIAKKKAIKEQGLRQQLERLNRAEQTREDR